MDERDMNEEANDREEEGDKSVSAFRNTTSSCTHRPSSYKHFNKMAIRVSITRVICFRRRKNASSTICRKTPPALGSPHLRRSKTTSVPTALEAVKGISCLTAALRPVFSGKGGGVNVIIAITDYFKKSLRTVLFLRFYENWRWRQHLNCRRGRAAPFDPARGTVRLRYTGPETLCRDPTLKEVSRGWDTVKVDCFQRIWSLYQHSLPVYESTGQDEENL
ncbi:hypothetical protein GEV33_003092 [Tenebrio molitor]|uniref:Uncharacterized protein n=1 Tax=Tenebrio molitor TaxID=7067 RepID=A0A8J6LEC4_TENMO|nr:hypothetical protein GEV33_003092 [Tenebrio molitor]